MSNFFAYLSKMKYIKRWGLMRNTREENIQEHSLQVAMIAHALAKIKNTLYGGDVDVCRVLELAVFHEAGEVITGDLVTPIKYYNVEIKKAYKEIEGVANKKLLDMLPESLKMVYAPLLSEDRSRCEKEWRIVKQADRICAYLKCVEELKTGNSEFERAKERIKADIDAMDAPEVKYFMDEFAPAFDLTLDELN
jgi:5'-deoxynucleotidase